MRSFNGDQSKQGVDYNTAMQRLVYLAVLGCLIIIGYSLGFSGNFVTIATVGLMCAGAALLAGGLIGFVFGVPHMIGGNSVTPEAPPAANGKVEQSANPSNPGSAVKYQPSTSLEQISDWLTKMLVGVGLIEIRSIANKVWEMATFVQKAMGGIAGADAFAVGFLVYFFISGFIFGFLWARLYLVQWFREVDQVRALGEKLDQIERRQFADAKALSLINHQLKRTADDPPATEREIVDAVSAASRPVRTLLFYQAQQVSEDVHTEDYDLKLQGVIATLKGLVESDDSERYFDNRAELSYALSRKKPPDLIDAEQLISKAIEIRDRQGAKGWKYYEMQRARYRILLDANFKSGLQSENATIERILADLRIARSEQEKWNRWFSQDPNVKKWLEINTIDPQSLNRRNIS